MQDADGSARPKRLRVLVVEDEYFIADEIARAAGAIGGEVIGPIPDVAGGLRMLAAGIEIDVAILDINLRGQPAFELADLLTDRGIPFVFATGYDAGAIPERFRLVACWEKPYDHAELAAAIAVIGAAGRNPKPG